jgi:hypothetical protein
MVIRLGLHIEKGRIAIRPYEIIQLCFDRDAPLGLSFPPARE